MYQFHQRGKSQAPLGSDILNGFRRSVFFSKGITAPPHPKEIPGAGSVCCRAEGLFSPSFQEPCAGVLRI